MQSACSLRVSSSPQALRESRPWKPTVAIPPDPGRWLSLSTQARSVQRPSRLESVSCARKRRRNSLSHARSGSRRRDWADTLPTPLPACAPSGGFVSPGPLPTSFQWVARTEPQVLGAGTGGHQPPWAGNLLVGKQSVLPLCWKHRGPPRATKGHTGGRFFPPAARSPGRFVAVRTRLALSEV